MKDRFVLAIALCLGSAGCAAGSRGFVQRAEMQKVWPPAPAEPRVRLLGEISGEMADARSPGAAGIWKQLLFGPSKAARLVTPQAVAVNGSGNRIAIVDANAGGVHVLHLTTGQYSFLGKGNNGDAGLDTPVAAAWGNDTLFVADAGRPAVVAFQGEKRLRSFGRERLSRPAGITYHPQRRSLFVSDAEAHCLMEFDASGRWIQKIGQRGAAAGAFNFPTHLACAANGDLLVSDSLNFRVQRIAPDGQSVGAFGQKGDAGGDFALPKGIDVDAAGNLWVVDAQFENVQAFDADGRLLLALGREGRGPGEFWLPAGMAIDADNRMWIADTYNRRVQIFELLP